MSCGKPVIASESGGIPEAIDDIISVYIIPINSGKLDRN